MNDRRHRRHRTGALALAGVVFVVNLPTTAGGADTAPAPSPEEAPSTPTASPAEGDEVPRMQCFTRHEDAQISRRRGRLLEAREALRICSRAACPSAIRADCVEWLDQIERSIPSVVVTARDGAADVPDVRVYIDGEKATERLTGAAIEVDPGEHRFRFESPGRPPIERAFLVSEGMKRRPIDVDFSPPGPPAARGTGTSAREPAPPLKPTLGVFDYVAGSLAVTALGTSAYFGAWALLSRNDLDTDCAPLCSDVDRESVETKLLVADLALGVAVFSLAFLYLHRVSGSASMSASRPRSLSLYVTPSQTANRLGLQGVF